MARPPPPSASTGQGAKQRSRLAMNRFAAPRMNFVLDCLPKTDDPKNIIKPG